jgi:signal transduction histidine kinase
MAPVGTKTPKTGAFFDSFSAFGASVAADGVFLLDKNGRISSWNRAMEKLTGLSFKKVRGKKAKNFLKIHSQDGSPIPCTVGKNTNQNQNYSIWHGSKLSVGKKTFFVCHIQLPVFNETGKQIGTCCVFQEAHIFKQLDFLNKISQDAQNKINLDDILKNLAEKISHFLKAEKLLFYLYDQQGGKLRAKFFKIFSKSAQPYKQRSLFDAKLWPKTIDRSFFTNEARGDPRVPKNLQTAFKINKYLSYNLNLQDKTIATIALINKSKDSFRNEDLSFLDSISNQMAAMIEKGILNHQLRKALISERQFVADIAHELRTPLTSLRSELEISLLKDRTVEEYKKNLTATLVDANQVCRKIQNIIDLTWGTISKKQFRTLDLTNLLSEVQEICEKLAANKGIKVNGKLCDPIFIKGNKARLAQALVNVCHNTVKNAPQSGKIMFKLQPFGNQVKILITNTGQGISKEDLPFIFDRFYRGTQKAKKLSSDISLAITKSIILAHKGTIEVANKKNQSTTFTITLPRI